MTNHIHRDEAVKHQMEQPYIERQVDMYLFNLRFWKENGYEFTEEQLDLVDGLWQVVKGENA